MFLPLVIYWLKPKYVFSPFKWFYKLRFLKIQLCIKKPG